MAINLAGLRRRGAPLAPLRSLVYGGHGVGKTSFAASAPSPVFLCVEDGIGTLDVDSWDLAKASYSDVMDGIGALYSEDHGYKTVVVDSADWLEPKIWAEACARGDDKGPWSSIETPGYGKGYTAATDIWREVMAGLDALRVERGMHVIIIAHAQQKAFNSPETEPYDRYQPKLHSAASALVLEWADLVLFCSYRVSTVKTDVGFKKKHTRGVSGGDRIFYTNERPAWLAKQRFNLPDCMSLDIGFAGLLDQINGSAAPVPVVDDAAA
ncbi:MAG: AAA family ATPase [Azospirillum sp.]|nr:AAA family ATPase [Azospirillum sp.]